MPVFTDLDDRVNDAAFNAADYHRRLPGCQSLAQHIALVHVSGRERSFDTTVANPPHEIPTSSDHGYYTDLTRRAENLMGIPPSAYFYAGRAHPDFGCVALAFSAACEGAHDGSASPFDTGGLVHPRRFVGVRLVPTDGEVERVEYGRNSQIPLNQWRNVFARVLAAYFPANIDYWNGKPRPCDPEGLYELNTDWRSWTFEIRFYEGQSIHERAAWCADEPTMETLRRLLDAQGPTPPGDPPTPLERFLQGPPALEPAGTPQFCERMEHWIREQVNL